MSVVAFLVQQQFRSIHARGFQSPVYRHLLGDFLVEPRYICVSVVASGFVNLLL